MGMVQMRLPDGTILMHGNTPYDPVKAHEYYLRTRKLKGREKGSSTFTVNFASGRKIKLTGQQLTEQQAYATKRVNDIKKKLAELNSKLKVAMREAKGKKAKAERKADKPETAAEKSKAARESKQYRAKNKTKLATKSRRAAESTKTRSKSLKDDPVAQLESRIDDVRRRLATAINVQRALAGATKNR